MNCKTWFKLLEFIQTTVVNGTFFKGSTSMNQVSPLIFLSRSWFFLILLMNVSVHGMSNSDKVDFSEYEYYKKMVDERIQQGLKGADLIKPKDEHDPCNLLKRLVYADDSEDDPHYSDLRQRIIDHDPEIKKLKGFFDAFLASLWKHRVKLTQWFIAEGVNVNLRPGKALGNVLLDTKDYSINQVIFIVRLLLLHNVNPNIQDEYGFTSLHSTAKKDFVNERDLCTIAQLLIIGGADCSLKTYNNCGPGSDCNEKTAVEIAHIRKRFELVNLIKQTALQRDNLFTAVARGENIQFRTVQKEELENWVSRCHARNIYGDSLLHCAFANNNMFVAQKLVKLWPQLVTQPNFKGETVLGLFPQKCVQLLLLHSLVL